MFFHVFRFFHLLNMYSFFFLKKMLSFWVVVLFKKKKEAVVFFIFEQLRFIEETQRFWSEGRLYSLSPPGLDLQTSGSNFGRF